MGAWRIALAVLPAAGVAAAAHAGPPPPSQGFAVSIAAPRAAELAAWTTLRVDVDNLAPAALLPHLTVTLPQGVARPAAARGAVCWGASPVECTLPAVGGAQRASVTLPVRWDGPGSKAVEARVRPESAEPGDTPATASATVRVYTLSLRDVRTTPARPRAGGRFSVSATLARSDTGAPVRARTLRCGGGLSVVPRGATRWSAWGAATVRGARLTCAWTVPAEVHNASGTTSGVRGWTFQALLLADTRRGGMVTKQPLLRRVR